MQAPYKEQKASNAVHLPLYWNVLSFSFTTIEFSLDKAFKWLCSTPLPLKRGEREGITYAELTFFMITEQYWWGHEGGIRCADSAFYSPRLA